MNAMNAYKKLQDMKKKELTTEQIKKAFLEAKREKAKGKQWNY